MKNTWIVLGLLLPQAVFAQTPAAHLHETIFFKGVLTRDQVQSWSALPGRRSFVIQAGDGEANADELMALSSLQGADRIQLETERYPLPELVPVFAQLAAQGVELVTIGRAGLPSDDEIDQVNQAGFSRCLLVLGFYPDASDARRLERLQCKLSLTFAVSAYPRFEDKDALSALPLAAPLLFVADYWPWYNHMDTLNLVPHRKTIRVLGMLPPEDSLPYLRNIQRLDDVQLVTDSDPEDSEWSKLSGLPVTWISRGHVPETSALAAFGQGTAKRRLIVDSDLPWGTEEHARISKAPYPVEWVHQ